MGKKLQRKGKEKRGKNINKENNKEKLSFPRFFSLQVLLFFGAKIQISCFP